MAPPKQGSDNNKGKRKQSEVRGEPSGVTIPTMNLFSVQPNRGQAQQSTLPMTNLFTLQQPQREQQLPCQFSSALQLNFNNQTIHEPDNLNRFMSRPFTSYTALLTDDLEEQHHSAPANIHHLVEQTTKAHSNEVRNMLYSVYRQHNDNLINSANEKVREKDEELRQARRRIAELEQTVRQLNYSGQFFQSRIRTLEERTALQEAALRTRAREAQQEDAESSSIDPNMMEQAPTNNRWGTCRACNDAEAKAIIFPCRHVCMCAQCANVFDYCPVCQGQIVNSYEIVLP